MLSFMGNRAAGHTRLKKELRVRLQHPTVETGLCLATA
jgi:hypothetical protein